MKNIFSSLFFILPVISLIFSGCSSDSSQGSYINVSQNEVIFEESGTAIVTIDSNDDWIASLEPANSSEWLKIDPIKGSAGKHTFYITTLNKNNGIEERSATVNIKSNNTTKPIPIKQEINYIIDLSTDKVEFEGRGNTPKSVTLTINSDWTYNLVKNNSFGLTYNIDPESKGKPGTFTITFETTEDNDTDKVKSAEFFIKTSKDQKSVKITQNRINESYKDKDIITLQQSTIGKGINLLFMGDGFTQETMTKGSNGAYEKAMRQAMDNFFSIEPYKSYRNYFNVYMIAAVSNVSGITSSKRDTAFKCYFGDGTLIEYDQDASMRYVNQVFGNTNVYEGDITVGIILNSTKYAGTCTMWSHGLSISRVPMSSSASPNNFKGLVQHEMGGHGFARVADEYIYYSTPIPSSEITLRRQWQGYGAYLNVDFTNNVSQVLWKDFIGQPKYADVNVYEGGLTYGQGVWRSESNSCMNNNVPYYNAPTRWAAVKRIMNIAGVPFTFQQFMQTDIIDKSNQSLAKSKVADREMPPLHPPIMIEK